MISKTYNPKEIEDKWYSYWLDNQYFKSKPNPDKEPYTIVIPPPNVTGVLHMGHMMNNTIQDVLVRKARMEGKEACWVPGTDHASIATEAKVVAMLKERGIEKKDLTREEFLKYAWEWTEKYGGIILSQLKKLGASCDWDRTRFTMEPSMYDAVIEVFVDLYNKGEIYRGVRMVNWDPQGKTAVSDEEVLTKEVQQKMCYIKYELTAPPAPDGGAERQIKDSSFWQKADPFTYALLKDFASRMRNQPTKAEEILWEGLKGKQLEANKFRRQHIIGQYIADFVCLKEKLIIEIDGSIHQLPENQVSDIERQEWLEKEGFNVIHFTNNEVLTQYEKVLDDILKEIKTRHRVLAPPSGAGGAVVIATVRPETIMADAAICVNPNDERYKHLIGKKALIPLINKEIPIIGDEYVTMDFGTGCLKVTPAHDQNDYELGVKHKLPVIDILNDDGTLNEKAQILVGKDRFVARKEILVMLQESGNLVKVEDYKSNVGFSERTNAVIEPRLSMQWFLKMKRLSQPALENVMNDNIQLVPPKFKNMYRSWMENVHDWCISRQLWWGQQIPAYYLEDGTIIVAKTKKEALKIAREKYQLYALSEKDLTQDPDVVDTWFSSWLWPITVFDGFQSPDNEDINYYYPTNDLVTAPEILFFWVARMIISGYEYRGKMPFKNVYLTGIVRDKLGRKMSKSLGNSPDPIELMEKYGADGVRTGMLFSSPAGNDLPFDEKLCEQGRNFSNKIWNAFRLVKGWTVQSSELRVESVELKNSELLTQNSELPVNWFNSRLNFVLAETLEHFDKFRISDALMSIYNVIWDDFCSQYLEMIKPAYVDGVSLPIDQETYEATLDFFDKLMRLAHPFMPFISEEIWQNIKEREAKTSICKAEFPKVGEIDQNILEDFDILKMVISEIRNIRNTKQISPKTALPLSIKTENQARYEALSSLIQKLANVSEITFGEGKDGAGFVVKSDEFTLNIANEIDAAVEIENAQKELDYMNGFKKSTEAKLSNERFVQNAKPEIIERERQKLADAEAKIKTLEELLKRLRG